jgi:hypothetical protein
MVAVVLASCATAPAAAPAAGTGGAARATKAAPATTHKPAGFVYEQQIPFQRWAPLPGKKVGLLVAVNSDWGTLIGWGKGLSLQASGQRVYWFLADGDSPRALYFESKGEGENFLENWSVPLPDGQPAAHYDAAMYGPATVNRYGLGEDAHLVEIEVNGGRGAPGNYLHFVATDVKVLDGSDTHPVRAREALAQSSTAFRALVNGQRKTIDDTMAGAAAVAGKPFGPEKTAIGEGVFPTWSSQDDTLRVLYVRHERRSSTHTEIRRRAYPCKKYRPPPSPPGGGGGAVGPEAPLSLPGGTLLRCPAPHDEAVSVTKSYGVEVAAEYVFDRTGRLVEVVEYAPAPLPYQAPPPMPPDDVD